jgi:phytoene dehydrogenase-like protein
MSEPRGGPAAADVVIVGAGLGGLACGAKLARSGRRVLIAERKPHTGGTSHVFDRKGYKFPMGPLGFGFPGLVRRFLGEAGADPDLRLERAHFQFLSPGLDIVYSRPLRELEAELARLFPAEKDGLAGFMAELDPCVRIARRGADANPDFLAGSRREDALRSAAASRDRGGEGAEAPCPDRSSAERLSFHIGDRRLRNFLGTMGSGEPALSLGRLASMWAVMAEEGIWFPEAGMHVLAERLARAYLAAGGTLRLASPVARIEVAGGRAAAVITERGERFEARWVVSNADAKRTLLELVDPGAIDPAERDRIRRVPYSESELCVYLGLDPGRVDWGRMRARHLFFRKRVELGRPAAPGDFEDADIEICRWGEGGGGLVPDGKAALVLRAGFPFEELEAWRTGVKARREGYRGAKEALARGLVETAEAALPGLASSVGVLEAATPLTYLDWGGRVRGSIAGWDWAAASMGGFFPRKLLVETSVENLLLAGAYAAGELFLGGVPTALHTGLLAADLILERDGRS